LRRSLSRRRPRLDELLDLAHLVTDRHLAVVEVRVELNTGFLDLLDHLQVAEGVSAEPGLLGDDQHVEGRRLDLQRSQELGQPRALEKLRARDASST
jgi:hypothetical protein